MPLETFNPPIAPSPGARQSPKLNLRQAEFGDGYTQSSPNGLRHRREVVKLRWNGLTEAQYIAIRNFLEQKGGYRPFYYQPRGRSVIMKWTCKEWSSVDGPPWALDATFEEDFSNEV